MTAIDYGIVGNLEQARVQVDHTLDRFLREKSEATDRHGLPPEIVAILRTFISSGAKRLRPQLCVLGWHAGCLDGSGES
jgi:geranylgeranyl diphosphate synthase, type I